MGRFRRLLHIAFMLTEAITLIASPVYAASKAEMLLQKTIKVSRDTKTLQATLIIHRRVGKGAGNGKASLLLQKPNLARFEADSPDGDHVTVLCDGHQLIIYSSVKNTYTTLPADEQGAEFAAMTTPIDGGIESLFFFGLFPMIQQMMAMQGYPVQADRLVAKVGTPLRIGDALCQTLRIFVGKKVERYRVYVDSDFRVRGGMIFLNNASYESHLFPVKYNLSLPKQAFQWTPPEGAQLVMWDQFQKDMQLNSKPAPSTSK